MLLGAEVARAGFDMESGDPSERFKETGALLQRAVRFLPSPVGARIAVPVMPATPSPRGPAPARLTTAPGRPPGVEAAQAAERPGTLSGLLLIGGLVAVAVACFRKR